MKTLVISLVCSCLSMAWRQGSPDPDGYLTGRIVEIITSDRAGVYDAEIRLMHDSVLIQKVRTDTDGYFRIGPVDAGVYSLHIYSVLIPEPAIINSIPVRAGRTFALGDIFISYVVESIVIKSKPPREMTMCGGAPLGSMEISRAPLRSGKGLFSKRKSAEVIDGRVYSKSVRGATSDAYYVDGVRTKKARSVPMSAIEEISDAVPAEYGDDLETKTFSKSIENSGILTAGEIHDFSKWNLWTDIAQGELGLYQQAWNIRLTNRYSVQVTSDKGKPVVDAEVELLSGDNKLVWVARTDNTGKAELWAGMYDSTKDSTQPEFTIRARHQGVTMSKKAARFSDNGVNHLTFSTPCYISNTVDAMFVVDATGSMADEINYLKSELNSIIGKFKQQNAALNLRTGCVFYRDRGDAYVTQQSEFSDNPVTAVNFIQNQNADGGGDFPEAVDIALGTAMNMNWSENARARLLFLVLDAPPHQDSISKWTLQKAIDAATEKGIRIIPITASGIDKSTEYLMRSMALATNGTYVFLTDHSGVGNPHIEPSTDSYDVEKLNSLLLRLFTHFTYAPECRERQAYNPYRLFCIPPIIKIASFGMVDSSPGKDTIIIDYTLPAIDTTIMTADTGSVADSVRVICEILSMPIDTTGQEFVTTDSPALSEEYSDSFFTSLDFVEAPKVNVLKCYPNPTQGLLNVEINSEMKEVYLADIAGKLLAKYQVGGEKRLQLRLDNFPTGMYFVKCEINCEWLSGKVILVR